MAYATPEFIADRLGRDLDDSETRIVTARLGDAERLIRSRIRDLDDRITAGTIDAEDVAYVETEAVLRLIRNPDGYTNEADGNYSYTINQDVASGVLAITDDEWRLLGYRVGAFALRPRVDIPWCGERADHPNDPWGPPVSHDPNHPAVWWGG